MQRRPAGNNEPVNKRMSEVTGPRSHLLYVEQRPDGLSSRVRPGVNSRRNRQSGEAASHEPCRTENKLASEMPLPEGNGALAPVPRACPRGGNLQRRPGPGHSAQGSSQPLTPGASPGLRTEGHFSRSSTGLFFFNFLKFLNF